VLHITYIDLPLIRNSNMGKLYLASEPEDQRVEINRTAVDVEDVMKAVQDIIDDKHVSGSRVILSEKSNL